MKVEPSARVIWPIVAAATLPLAGVLIVSVPLVLVVIDDVLVY